MGLVRGMAKTAVIAGTATATSNAVNRRQAKKNVKAYEDAYAETAPPQQAQPAAAPANDPTTELAKLQDLLDQGLITQDDYDAKKKQILGL